MYRRRDGLITRPPRYGRLRRGDRPLPRDLHFGLAFALSHADYPADVADWYETMAREVMRALDEADAHERVASDDALWSGPRPDASSP